MNRRAFLPTCLLAAALPVLSGCSAVDPIVDYFGPRPDTTLEELANAAARDALALEELDPPAAQLRAEQADALYAEITRLCGVNEHGESPHSCEVERPTTPSEVPSGAPSGDATAALLSDARAKAITATADLPGESRDLIISQAIALRAWTQEDTPAVPALPTSAADQATTLLNWEYEQVYGLDFARAYAGSELVPNIDTRLKLHEERIRAMQAALEPVAKVPQPATAYAGQDAQLPTDAASAQRFVDALGWNDTLTWTQAASVAAHDEHPDADWVGWLIDVAAQSQAL